MSPPKGDNESSSRGTMSPPSRGTQMTPQPKASSEPKERTERLTHAHAHTCEGSGPNGSGPVTVSKKPFAVAIQESEIQELQTKYRPLDVQTLLPEAAAKCADKYPGGGPMKREFFERYL